MARIPGFFMDHVCCKLFTPFVPMFLAAKMFRYAQVAHIPGALYVDIDGISDRTTHLPPMLPLEEAFAAAVSALGISNHDKVIVYDGKGFYSAPRVWW
uniref:Rhodanese domain-containing protein n=1 Tax=Hordeum vulgare subsp. vulgare TaxID=112509 RepID=A0A8I6Y2I1_HORVV